MKTKIITGTLIVGALIWGAVYSGTQETKQEAAVQEVIKDYQIRKSNSFERNDDPTFERSFEDYGDYDCSDFDSQAEAQEFFESEGGPSEDYHNLDRNGDGFVCESLE